MMIARK